MNAKAANAQRKTLEDLQKAQRTTARGQCKALWEILAPWKQNIKKWGRIKTQYFMIYTAHAGQKNVEI